MSVQAAETVNSNQVLGRSRYQAPSRFTQPDQAAITPQDSPEAKSESAPTQSLTASEAEELTSKATQALGRIPEALLNRLHLLHKPTLLGRTYV